MNLRLKAAAEKSNDGSNHRDSAALNELNNSGLSGYNKIDITMLSEMKNSNTSFLNNQNATLRKDKSTDDILSGIKRTASLARTQKEVYDISFDFNDDNSELHNNNDSFGLQNQNSRHFKIGRGAKANRSVIRGGLSPLGEINESEEYYEFESEKKGNQPGKSLLPYKRIEKRTREFGPKDKWKDRDQMMIKGEKGNSYLHDDDEEDEYEGNRFLEVCKDPSKCILI